jgi:hypothetical protein
MAAAHAAPTVTHAAHAATFAGIGATLGSLGSRLVEFGARDAAIIIGVQPIEHLAGALGAALLVSLARFLGRGAAIIVEVEARETLIDPLDHLLASDVRIAVEARPRLVLSNRGAGHDGQGGATEENERPHMRLSLR